MPRDAVSRTANVGTVGMNGLIKYLIEIAIKGICQKIETHTPLKATIDIIEMQFEIFDVQLIFVFCNLRNSLCNLRYSIFVHVIWDISFHIPMSLTICHTSISGVTAVI